MAEDFDPIALGAKPFDPIAAGAKPFDPIAQGAKPFDPVALGAKKFNPEDADSTSGEDLSGTNPQGVTVGDVGRFITNKAVPWIKQQVVNQASQGAEDISKSAQAPATEGWGHIPGMQTPLIPSRPLGIAKGIYDIATSPLAPATQAWERGVSGLTGGMITPDEAGTALMGLRPGRSTPTGVRAPEPPPAPTTQELYHTGSQANYNPSRGMGVEAHAQPVQALGNQIRADLDASGYSNNRQARPIYREIRGMETWNRPTVTYDELENMYRNIRDVGRETGMTDAARRGMEAITSFRENISPQDIANNPQFARQAHDLIMEGRGNWAAGARSEQLDNLLYRATMQNASNASNATPDVLRKMTKNWLVKQNEMDQSGFTDAELEKAARVVQGTLAGNIAKTLGSFSSPHSLRGIGLGGLAHAMGVTPTMIGGAYGVGEIARFASRLSNMREFRELHDMVRRRSPLANQQLQNQPTVPVSRSPLPLYGIAAQGSSSPQQ